MKAHPETIRTAYDLAHQLVVLHSFAVNRWLDKHESAIGEQFEESVPAEVDRVVGLSLKLIEKLQTQIRTARGVRVLASLHEAVSSAWEDYRRDWNGLQHRAQADSFCALLDLAHVEHFSDAEYDTMVRRPMKNLLDSQPPWHPHWPRIRERMTELPGALPALLGTWFLLGRCLAVEVYDPAAFFDRYGDPPKSRLRWLSVDFAQELKALLSRLQQDFPGLEGLTCDLSVMNTSEAEGNIRRLHDEIVRRLPGIGLPHWDPESGQLSLGGVILMTLKKAAGNQRQILDKFQLEGWPQRVGTPFSNADTATAKSALREAIKQLNKTLKEAQGIKFRGDGSRKGIRWEVVP